MFPPGMVPPQQPPVPSPTPGIQTGPSPSFMTRLAGGLNNAAQQFGDPMSQGIAKQTSPLLNKKKKPGQSKQELPVNGPPGMKPAASIMQTGNSAPNPYTSFSGGVGNPQPGGYGGLAPMQNSGMGFWNQYNQNRPSMM